MKKPLLFIFFISISLGLKLSAQTNTENTTDSKKISGDFPVYINTGNPELDGANYDKAKLEWIKNNPEAYKAQIESTSKTNSTVETPQNEQDNLQFQVSTTQGPSSIPNKIDVDAKAACVLKNDVYIISRKKFLTLSAEVQFYIQVNQTVFTIKEK